jgi:hypothetical protein
MNYVRTSFSSLLEAPFCEELGVHFMAENPLLLLHWIHNHLQK